MDLLLVAALMTFALLVFVFGLVFLTYKLETARRRRVFLKISREYGLASSPQNYPLSTIIIKDRAYIRFSVAGTVRGHTILIEDIFTNIVLDQSYGFFMFASNLPYGRGLPMRIKTQTRVTIDGTVRVLDDTNFFNAVPYKEIKELLDGLV